MKWVNKLDPTAYNVMTVLNNTLPEEELIVIFNTKQKVDDLNSYLDHKKGISSVESLGFKSKHFEEMGAKIRFVLGDIGLVSFTIKAKEVKNQIFENFTDIVTSIGVGEDSHYVLNDSRKMVMGETPTSFDGSGTRVAVVDSGVDTHPDLNVIAHFDFSSDASNPEFAKKDICGHGTHVAGIISGKGVKNSEIKGVAIGAEIINAKGLNAMGIGSNDGIFAAITKACKDHKADVINLSLGSPEKHYNMSSSMKETFVHADDSKNDFYKNIHQQYPSVVIVASAGNNGPEYKTLNVPGAFEEVICVGSVNKDKKMSYFSSRGSNNHNKTKPDVVAPGGSILATKSKYEAASSKCEFYTVKSGTSMSCPHVSGLAALLCKAIKSQNLKSLTNTFDRHTYIKKIMMNSAINLQFDANTQGAGLINFPAAKKLIESKKEVVEVVLAAPDLRYEMDDSVFDKSFTMFKDIIPFSSQSNENLAEIANMVTSINIIQTKYDLSSLGVLGNKLMQASIKNPCKENLFVLRFNIPIFRIRTEIEELLPLEENYANITNKYTIRKAMKNVIASIDSITNIENKKLILY
ncbi:MAG: S8 family serine peptidase [Asgard group archaeon]|nr:S8 family serine peptidase [Asgard group archaeon]